MAGLPWFSVHTDFPEHPKSVRLGKLIKNPLAFAYVVRLWAFCAEYQPDGRFLGEDAAAMLEETAAGWEGKPGLLLEALIRCGRPGECGYVERTEGGYYVHEWVERNAAHLRKRERDNARPNSARRARQNPPEPRHNPARGPEETQRGVSAGEGDREGEREEDLHIQKAGAGVTSFGGRPAGAPAPRGERPGRTGVAAPEFELLEHWRRAVWPRLSSAECPEPDGNQVTRLRALCKSPGLPAMKAAMDAAAADGWWGQPGKLDLSAFLSNAGKFIAMAAPGGDGKKPRERGATKRFLGLDEKTGKAIYAEDAA